MINEKLTRKYCCEDISLIENYELAVADKTQTWDIHHKLELQDSKQVSMGELIEQGLYYGRPAEELVFLTRSEHSKLHNFYDGENHPMFGKQHSEETRQRMSNSLKGKPKPKYKWQDMQGNIHIMDAKNAKHHHPDWTKIDEN